VQICDLEPEQGSAVSNQAMAWTLRFAAMLLLSGLVIAQDGPRFEAFPSFAKSSRSIERRPGAQDAYVLLGPQDGLYFNWFLRNQAGTALQLPSPAESVAVRVEPTDGRSVPLITTFEEEMRRRTRSESPVTRRPYEPLGLVQLEDGEGIDLHGVVRRADGQPLSPGEYAVTFDTLGLGAALRQVDGARWAGPTTRSIRVRLIIDPVDTAASEIQYLHIEAAFHMGHDPDKVLELRQAVVTLSGAQVTDRMALGKAYAELGRHVEAVRVFDPILPELLESVQRGGLLREGRHLRQIAPSYLAVGRRDTARRLLEADGVAAPSSWIPEILKMLSKRREPQRYPWYRWSLQNHPHFSQNGFTSSGMTILPST
jgi:hypothetical protein